MKKNITFLILLLFVMSNMQGQILIGNGTLQQRHVPFDASFSYSYSQTIYLASEINSSGNITSIKWYYNGTVDLAASQDLKIYLGHTTKSAFANNTDWNALSGLQLSYTGGITASAPGWVTINLTVPFAYNGTDNLLIATSETQPGNDFIDSSFYSSQVTNKRSLSLYSNTVVPDPTDPASANALSKFVPNIVFGGISLACNTPLFVTPSDVTSSAATLTWDASSTNPAGGSEYYISQTNDNISSTQAPTGSVASGNSVTINDLLSATTYYVWVRNVCNGTAGNWSYSTSFMTLCNPLATFSENFDDPQIPWPLPTCWASIIRGTMASSANIGVIGGAGHSGQSAIQIANNDADSSTDIILVTPELTTLSLGTHRLKFFADGNGINSLEIGTLSSNTQDAVFTPIGIVETTANYAEYAVSFTSYTGSDSYVGIRLNSVSEYNPIFIDDIRWEVAPLCPDVTQVVIDPITPETATINWPANGVTQWQLVYGPDSATDPDALTAETINTNSTKTLTGLTQNTPYKVWIRTVCGANPGFWTGPITFRSACPETNTLSENFDTVETPVLPDCWSKILRGPSLDQNNASIETTNYNYNSAPNAVRLSNGFSNSYLDDDIILVSPNFGTISTKPHRVKFYARGNAQFEVGTLTGNNNNAVFTNFQAIQTIDDLTEYTVDFTPYSGTDTYIGFRVSSIDYYTNAYIDDIRWEEVPLCPDVTDIAVPTVLENSATVNWQAGNSEALWNVVYTSTAVTDPTTLTPINDASDTTLTINDLAPNTTYKVWVRSVCGINNGAWIGPVSFKTACTATTEFDENFDSATNTLPDCWSKILRGDNISESAGVSLAGYNSYSAPNGVEVSNNNSTGDYDVILVSPPLSNVGAGTHRLKFYAYSNELAPIEVGTLNSNTDQAGFIGLESITTTATYTQYVVNFTDYEGTDNYVGIRLNGPENISVFIDNVVWETIPLCPDALNLSTSGTTTDTATVAWESDGSGTSWQVAYGPETATDPNLLTPESPVEMPMTTINGLTPSTTYKFWVRTVCGGANGNGAWIGPVTFKTQCPPMNGFDENFDTTNAGKLPECWSSILRGSTLSSDARVRVVSNHSVSGTHAVIIDNDNSNLNDDIILISPAIENFTTAGYVLTFKADGDDPTNFEVGTLDGNGEDATFTLFQGLVTTNDYTDFTIDLSSYNGPDKYIGIRHNDSGNFTPIYIDDIKLQSTLSTGGFDNNRFTYYPNPVKNILNLSYTQNITDVTVYNLLGQIVISNKNNATTSSIDMSHLPSGSYIVKVAADNQIKTIKVVKE